MLVTSLICAMTLTTSVPAQKYDRRGNSFLKAMAAAFTMDDAVFIGEIIEPQAHSRCVHRVRMKQILHGATELPATLRVYQCLPKSASYNRGQTAVFSYSRQRGTGAGYYYLFGSRFTLEREFFEVVAATFGGDPNDLLADAIESADSEVVQGLLVLVGYHSSLERRVRTTNRDASLSFKNALLTRAVADALIQRADSSNVSGRLLKTALRELVRHPGRVGKERVATLRERIAALENKQSLRE